MLVIGKERFANFAIAQHFSDLGIECESAFEERMAIESLDKRFKHSLPLHEVIIIDGTCINLEILKTLQVMSKVYPARKAPYICILFDTAS